MRIAITRTDGGASIMLLVQQADGSWPDPDGEVAKWKELHSAAADAMHYQSHRVISEDEVLPDPSFRNAWKDGKDSVGIDMDKCRDIQRQRIREARAPLFADLDTHYLRADEAGDSAKKIAIVAQKQALRDVTADPRIDAATTPEELKAVWPECLCDKPLLVSGGNSNA